MRSHTVRLRRLGQHPTATAGPPVGRFLVPGEANGEVAASNVPISFMMGVEPTTGIVMDKHHPLLGTSLKDKILVLPRGRGSCAASGVILELLYLEIAPAALVFRKMEDILTLGVLLAGFMFSKSIPVVLVDDESAWEKLTQATTASINKQGLVVGDDVLPLGPPYSQSIITSPTDDKILRGEGCSRAAQASMELIVEFASIQGAKDLIDVSQVHIDACCYVGQTSLLVPQKLLELGARVAVPSTCNSLNVDKQRWQALGMDPELSIFASKIGDAYLDMGAAMSFTCAPYLLDSKPNEGEQVGWGESNAVVFANSVLGARTQKYPDYLDVLIAITGRAPALGCHLSEGRQPNISIRIPELEGFDESLFPLLGYHIGSVVGGDIPIIYGLENSNPGVPDLKAFGAGFATTSSAPMFHIRGVTPEAASVHVGANLPHVEIGSHELMATWRQLNTATDDRVDVISLGNPHFASEEFPRLVKLIEHRTKLPHVDIIITMSRFVYEKAKESGDLDKVAAFGATFVTDTCWCMLEEPIIKRQVRNIMTNSAKYAHYGPGVSGKKVHFGSMAGCIEAACTGKRASEDASPSWLFGSSRL